MVLDRQFDRLRQVWAYWSVFADVKSIKTYRKLLFSPQELPKTVELAVRALPGRRLICRTGTADVTTLWETFYFKFHLPNRPLNRPACIVDLGANVGYTAAHFARLYPSARAIAVEMDRDNHHLCAQNTLGLLSSSDVLEAAVWNENGTLNYSDADSNAYSLCSSQLTNEPKRSATAKTLDTIFDERGVDRVDYLKMDIEGAEAAVLGNEMRWAERVKQISVEIHPPATFENCASALASSGFRCEKSNRRSSALMAWRP